MTTIFLAEGEKHVCEAMRLTLEHQPGFLVAGEAHTAESALAQVCQHPLDIVLLDWALPGLHPQRLLTAMKQCCSKMLIIATSVRPEHEQIALNFGADGFLLKQLPPDQYFTMLFEIIENIAQQQKSHDALHSGIPEALE